MDFQEWCRQIKSHMSFSALPSSKQLQVHFSAFWGIVPDLYTCCVFFSYLFCMYSISHKCQVNTGKMKLLGPKADLKLPEVSCLQKGKEIFWKQERDFLFILLNNFLMLLTERFPSLSKEKA